MSEIVQLKKIRKALGLNQNDFANSIGLTQGGYSDIERGKNGISGTVKKMLILVHHINITFLDGKGEMFYIEMPTDETELSISSTPMGSDTKDSTIALLQADIDRLKAERDLYIELLNSKDKTIESLEKQLKNK
ncbi:transcriptional regulator with XRE-family HTH domain [Pedobacter sp. CG_S7]|uniref:helix-turn-helix domain-containing protein n=1 Tax=Pedobacter sp. CG_S7 TaxID=3143930 RepID=UPI0033964193